MSEVVATVQKGLTGKYHPYPEYKDSGVDWLGCIPRDWNKLALKHSLERAITDGPHETPVFIEEGVPFMSIDSIQNNKLVFDGCRYISIEDHKRYAKKCLPKRGDLLLGKAASVGKIAHVTTDNEFNVWSPLAVIRVDSCKHNSRFFYYSFQSSLMQYQCQIKSNSNTQANLGMGDISNLQFVYPTLPIQQTIAAFLDYETARIDRLIAQQQRLIELLKEKRQAVISHAVTKGLNPDAPMKNSGVEWLGQVPEHWVTHALKYAASSCKKSFTDGDWIETPYISDEGVRLLQTGNIGIGHFKEQGFRYISEHSFKTLKCTEVKPNDVLICRLDGPVGRSCLAPHLDVKMITSVDNAILKPSDDFDAEFLVYLTNSVGWLEWIQDICRVGGGFRLRISRTMLGEQIIPVPPIDEQKAIAKELNLLSEYTDLCIQKCTEAIALLVERRSALISAAVTGKIDLRGWTPPADEVAA